ncbi:MAG: putative D,D-dipeptide transport system permease protein DdpC [Stenotrophomonas maltophilia]|nr:MAG: putative D,D-dipeptide transport system permease protein DdpC [Stenotrophomonas maltophilia]
MSVSALASDASPGSRLQAYRILLGQRLRALLGKPLGLTGLLIVGGLLALVLLAPWLGLQAPNATALGERLQAPSAQHWFGTDGLGRDLFARAVWGGRPTLLIVLLVLLASAPLGTLVGAAAGLFGGIVDRVLMRVTDVFMAFPRLILALAVAAVLGGGIGGSVLAISLTGWTAYARIARAESHAWRDAEFIQAARVLGASPWRLLWRHLFVLCLPSMLVRASLDAPGIILIVSGLGFLGLGLAPPAAEWGAMVADGRALVFESWWVSTLPGLMIVSAGLGFNLLGDALRDVLDPGAH